MAWGITMHNHVNARNNKKIHSVRDALRAIIENDDRCILKKNEQLKNKSIDKFDNNNSMNNSTNNNNSMNNITLYLSISIIIIVLLILYLLLKNKIF